MKTDFKCKTSLMLAIIMFVMCALSNVVVSAEEMPADMPEVQLMEDAADAEADAVPVYESVPTLEILETVSSGAEVHITAGASLKSNDDPSTYVTSLFKGDALAIKVDQSVTRAAVDSEIGDVIDVRAKTTDTTSLSDLKKTKTFYIVGMKAGTQTIDLGYSSKGTYDSIRLECTVNEAPEFVSPSAIDIEEGVMQIIEGQELVVSYTTTGSSVRISDQEDSLISFYDVSTGGAPENGKWVIGKMSYDEAADAAMVTATKSGTYSETAYNTALGKNLLKTASYAKIQNKDGAFKLSSVVKGTGKSELGDISSIAVGNTKPQGKQSGVAYIRLVSSTMPNLVYAEYPIYVRPNTPDSIELLPLQSGNKTGFVAPATDDNYYTLDLALGTKFTVKPAVYGAAVNGATKAKKTVDATVIYSTDRPDILQISTKGVITPIAVTEGEDYALLTVRTNDTRGATPDEHREPVWVTAKVRVKPQVKSIVLSSKSLTLAPGGVQSLLVRINPTYNFDAKVDVTYAGDSLYSVYEITTPSAIDTETSMAGIIAENPNGNDGIKKLSSGDVINLTNGFSQLIIKLRDLKDDETFKTFKSGLTNANNAIKFVYDKTKNNDTITKKNLETSVKLSAKEMPDNIKKLTEKNKTQYINIPVGVPYDMRTTVSPASAINHIVWDGDLEVKDGYIFPEETGHYYIWGVTDAVDATNSTMMTMDYQINVYCPITSVVPAVFTSGGAFDDESLIYAGYLIDSDVVLTTRSTNIKGGTQYSVGLTYNDDFDINGVYEPISWTSSNQAGLSIIKGSQNEPYASEVLYLSLNAPGTYTITGKTAYTKQKYSFKVKVDGNMSTYDSETNPSGNVAVDGSNVSLVNGAELTLNIPDSTPINANTYKISMGQKYQLDISAKGIAGKIAITSSDKTKVAVTDKGVITPKAAGSADITVTMTSTNKGDTATISKTIKVNVESNISLKNSYNGKDYFAKDSYATDAKVKAKVSIAGDKINNYTVKWYVYKEQFGDTLYYNNEMMMIYDKEDIEEKSVLLAEGNNSEIDFSKVKSELNISDSALVYVYPVLIKDDKPVEIIVTDPYEGDIRAYSNAKPVYLFDTAVNKTYAGVKKLTAARGTTYTIPVSALAKDTSKVPSRGFISWTSSNNYIAGIDYCSINEDPESASYGDVTFTTGAKASGTATITGTFLNSGKKVSFKVIIDKDAPAAPTANDVNGGNVTASFGKKATLKLNTPTQWATTFKAKNENGKFATVNYTQIPKFEYDVYTSGSALETGKIAEGGDRSDLIKIDASGIVTAVKAQNASEVLFLRAKYTFKNGSEKVELYSTPVQVTIKTS